ncbi:uncharacterized protein BXZ73DRAFT_49749 [Epithele typhae]|uniref:uncharacterized protein n=1 Tax=Epithele typhae TaxID=378194 RepID=UPI002007B082|nr:uncharacterized protein BXZ73DRAFT_49749 [Epithele typhae]KAH9925849.1 hypothetical protein BXZ73DRAFT_49749 [Epithele typhae]
MALAPTETEPQPPSTEEQPQTGRKRPRLDMAVAPRERKRGKTMFGLVLGTLNKAKNEDKERNASEAAKKRQLIEQRLQSKLQKETDTVRRAEEAKKDKTSANRKEEELQLRDSIHKLRRTRFPVLANFLLTSDVVLAKPDPDAPAAARPPPRSRPPPIYYLPAKLLPSQETFLLKRKEEIQAAAELEWSVFKEERTAGIEDINRLRERVAEEETRQKASKGDDGTHEDTAMAVEDEGEDKKPSADDNQKQNGNSEVKMDTDEGMAKEEKTAKTEDTPAPEAGDGDDALEF